MPRVRSRRLGAPAAGGGADGTGPVTALYEDHADHTTAGTSEETLDSFSLPGGTLAADGDCLRISGRGIAASNGNNKTLLVKFGATTVATMLVASSGDGWDFSVVIRRSGAATQVASGSITRASVSAFSTVGGQFTETTPAETLSGALTIAVAATTPSSAGDFTLKSWHIDKIAAEAVV